MNMDEQRWSRRLERERQARQEAERLLEDKSRALYDANQALTALTGDLERQVAERTAELAQALTQAEAATRAKSEFLAMMSHEIRTPLSGILGTAELLSLSPLNDEQQAQLHTLQRSGDALRVLINDILDFSKIEAGKLDLESRPFALRDELHSTLDLYRPNAAAKGLKLLLDVAPTVPEHVQGDSTRLRQILSNLLSNAIKFTHQGVVRVSAQARTDEDGRIRLKVSVSDSGIGIPVERQDQLFQPFSQIDRATTRQYGGTGLGLVISARLCEAMSGGITVESRQGVGTTFRFHVLLLPAPASAPAQELPPPQTSGPTPPLRVLVVDDHVVNRMLAQGMLKKLGIDADQAVNGREAVDCASRQHYDLILMDMQMPEMDGIEATRAIRELCLQTQPWIVAVTANAYESDRERCLQAGMNDFLSKPFRMDDLRAKLAALPGR